MYGRRLTHRKTPGYLSLISTRKLENSLWQGVYKVHEEPNKKQNKTYTCTTTPLTQTLLEGITMGNMESQQGGMTTFNIDYGMEEALIRGFRSGFMTPQQYAALMDYKEGNDTAK
jgi:hypothetical protein